MASLLEQIEAVQTENRSVEVAVDDLIRRQRATDQSRIAWVIIWAFVVCVAGVFLLVLGQLVLSGEDAEWKERAEFLVDLVSSVLLPVVTLVLGYYFGKENAA